MASIPKSRLLELTKLQASLFSHTYNPSRLRLGNKVLRQRLRGPKLAAWYPRKSTSIMDMLNGFKRFDLEGGDEDEDDRLENVQYARLRGKGPPKKLRTADGGRASKKKKR